MKKYNIYQHWYFGENILKQDGITCLINFQYGIAIFFNYANSYMASFEEFKKIIADVQFFSGDRPKDVDDYLKEGWNFLSKFEEEEDPQATLRTEDDEY